MFDITIIFALLILLISVVVHEVSHGYAALFLGDHTAEYEGRLTLNPIKHIDLLGTIILPTVFYLLGGFIFGWAKPVPYNPYNLRNQRWGEAIVAIAGPLANIMIALVFGLAIRFFVPDLGTPLGGILTLVVAVNTVLALFNLMPVPPLDGSKILWSFLPPRLMYIRERIERFGFFAVLLFVFILWQFVVPLIGILFLLITGKSF